MASDRQAAFKRAGAVFEQSARHLGRARFEIQFVLIGG
jgi:hypothetical protein